MNGYVNLQIIAHKLNHPISFLLKKIRLANSDSLNILRVGDELFLHEDSIEDLKLLIEGDDNTTRLIRIESKLHQLATGLEIELGQ